MELQDRPTAEQLAHAGRRQPLPARSALAPSPRTSTEGDPRTLLDLIEDHPALRGALTWPTLLELLPPLRPRHYSVSSSPATDPGHVDLMVSLLRPRPLGHAAPTAAPAPATSTRCEPGDTVLARVQPCREAFRIEPRRPHPSSWSRRAPGSRRSAAPSPTAGRPRRGAELAPALCYFGCDAPDADFLHADELRAAETAGAVSAAPRLQRAPEDGRRFVQHRIAAEADEVWELLDAGARVYVCGDGARMAPGVREAFRTLYRGRTPTRRRRDGRRAVARRTDRGRALRRGRLRRRLTEAG